MEQRRLIPPPQSPATPPASTSSPLLTINDDLYELLQSTTTRSIAPGALKMEPELGDFMASSYTWGSHLGTQLFDNSSQLTCLTSFTQQQQGTHQQQQQQLPDIATPFAASYTPPPPATPQIQALRDFMVYGNMATPSMSPAFSSAMSSRATTPVATNGSPALGNGPLGGLQGFYHQLEEVDGIPGPSIPMPSLAYRALCSEIYATERSPHRSQFQRENHILAERQRREEMNEKFSALRAMIPKATKKDKASIVGDTIDYVLELEKRLKQLQACKDSASTGAVVCKSSLKRKSPYGSRCEDAGGVMAGGSSSETTGNANANVVVSVESPGVREAHSAASSPSTDQITLAESKLPVCLSGKMKEAAAAEVDVQQLGKQAVVKVVCSRRPGHVLRVLNALEECKVEVLQSNVMTVADNSIHFVAIELEEGVSAPTEELISAVLQAIDPAEA